MAHTPVVDSSQERAEDRQTSDQTPAPASAGPAGMLGAATGALGARGLQRKLRRRAQARRAAATVTPVSGIGAKYVKEDGAALVSDVDVEPQEVVVAHLKEGDLVTTVDLGADQEFNQLDDARGKRWKVRVSRGEAVGQQGWIKASALDSVYDIKDAGQVEHREKVGEGEVTVSDKANVDLKNGQHVGDNMVSMRYSGNDADRNQWLQFVWREVTYENGAGVQGRMPGMADTLIGKYPLTQGGTPDNFGKPTKQNYNTDSKDKENPFFEAAAVADRTADSTTIFDQPGALADVATRAFKKKKARRVVSRAHLATFLVKGRKIVFRANVHVQWSFLRIEDTANPPKGNMTVADAGAAETLPAEIRERFHEQYPKFKDVQ